MYLHGAVSISALVRQALVEMSCYQWAFQEPYDGKCLQLHCVPHCIRKVERNVLPDGHQLLEIRQSVLQSFGWSIHTLRWWLHTFLLPQSWWKHWVAHATACIWGTYDVCTSKETQWCWGMYLLSDEIRWLVVEWTGTIVEFHHSYDYYDSFHSYVGRLELRLSLYLAVQTRNILETNCATRTNGQ